MAPSLLIASLVLIIAIKVTVFFRLILLKMCQYLYVESQSIYPVKVLILGVMTVMIKKPRVHNNKFVAIGLNCKKEG